MLVHQRVYHIIFAYRVNSLKPQKNPHLSGSNQTKSKPIPSWDDWKVTPKVRENYDSHVFKEKTSEHMYTFPSATNNDETYVFV